MGALSAGLALLLVGGALSACSPKPEPVGEGFSDTTTRAYYCNELDNAETIEATRTALGIDQTGMEQLIAACGASATNGYIDDLLPSVTNAVAATPTQIVSSALSALQQTFPITDSQGYTFDLAVDFELFSVTADPTSQPPGVTAASRDIDMAMTLTNTTPGRAITFKDVGGIVSPLSLPTFLLSAVYSKDNPVCVGLQLKRGCEWPMAYGRMESSLTIPAGETYTLKVGAVPNGAGYDATLLKGIPEASWEEIYPSLTHPDGYKIVYSGGDGYRFTPACGKDT